MNARTSSNTRPVHRFLAALIVAFACACAHAAGESENASAFYEDALVQFDKGDYDAAVIQLKNVLQGKSDHLPSRVLLGRAYLRSGNPHAAEKELRIARSRGADAGLVLVPLAGTYLAIRKFKELLAEIPNHGHSAKVDYRLSLIHGQANLALLRFDAAEQAFMRADQLVADTAAPLVGQAKVALARELFDVADDLVGVALKRKPDSPEAWYVKGNVARARRDFERALSAFDRTLALNDGHLKARLKRAATLIELGRDDEAARDVQFVKDHSLFDVEAIYLNALIRSRRDDATGVQAELGAAREVISSLPSEIVASHSPTLLLSALIAYSDGRSNDAIERLHLFRQDNPDHIGARKLLAQIVLEGGDARSARDLLEPLLARTPNDVVVLKQLGNVYMAINRYELATEMYERAGELVGENADIKAQVAQSQVARGDRPRAVAILQEILTAQPDSFSAGVMLAQLHLEGEEYADAIAVVTGLLRHHPENSTLLNLLGTAHVAGRDFTNAVDAYSKALEAEADFLPGQLNLAKVERLTGDAEAARARLEAVLVETPDEIETMTELATLAEEEGDLDKALFWLEKVRAAKPDAVDQQLHLVELYLRVNEPETAAIIARELELRHPETLNVLLAVGLTEIAVDRQAAAVRTFKRMSGLAVNEVQWLFEISRYQVQVNDLEGARWTLEKAVLSAPDFVEAQSALASIETRLERFEKALARAEQLKASDPSSARGHIVEAEIYLENRQYAKAAGAFRKAFDSEPDSALAIKTYSALRDANELDAGLDFLGEWVTGHADDQEARRALALGYIYAGRREVALKEHLVLAEALPQDTAIMNNLAWLYQEAGDERAFEFAKRAFEKAPEHPDVLDTYGWILVERSDSSRGLDLLREAHVRDADSAEIRYHIAVALARLGRKDEALEELRKLVSLQLLDFHGAEEARALLSSLIESAERGGGQASPRSSSGKSGAEPAANLFDQYSNDEAGLEKQSLQSFDGPSSSTETKTPAHEALR